ncbi:MAG TPA: polysaccharide deacetylase family protein [Gemmatimonadaceae bacterium]|nr:polysaccharide deacetylase family protein [Gemmatimonadaceae bacterium]
MSRRLKAALGFLIFQLGLHRIMLRRKAIVVLFHRVDDRYASDAISCSVEKFERFCTFFCRYFTVVPLGTLVEKVQRGEDVSGHLVVTFDDGYLDNHQIAAPLLKRRQVPACFFIATDFVESDRVPWWDREAGIQSEWMSWDQVRDLAAQGFELGAHTCNHVDLGVVNGEEARREITDSGTRLAKEVGVDVGLFSYPYGRRNQITDANRQLVRDAGYDCCMSAYGGNVTPDSNPYDLRRIPISQWYVSAYQFGFEALRA